jgi:hypothetical protein
MPTRGDEPRTGGCEPRMTRDTAAAIEAVRGTAWMSNQCDDALSELRVEFEQVWPSRLNTVAPRLSMETKAHANMQQAHGLRYVVVLDALLKMQVRERVVEGETGVVDVSKMQGHHGVAFSIHTRSHVQVRMNNSWTQFCAQLLRTVSELPTDLALAPAGATATVAHILPVVVEKLCGASRALMFSAAQRRCAAALTSHSDMHAHPERGDLRRIIVLRVMRETFEVMALPAIQRELAQRRRVQMAISNVQDLMVAFENKLATRLCAVHTRDGVTLFRGWVRNLRRHGHGVHLRALVKLRAHLAHWMSDANVEEHFETAVCGSAQRAAYDPQQMADYTVSLFRLLASDTIDDMPDTGATGIDHHVYWLTEHTTLIRAALECGARAVGSYDTSLGDHTSEPRNRLEEFGLEVSLSRFESDGDDHNPSARRINPPAHIDGFVCTTPFACKAYLHLRRIADAPPSRWITDSTSVRVWSLLASLLENEHLLLGEMSFDFFALVATLEYGIHELAISDIRDDLWEIMATVES